MHALMIVDVQVAFHVPVSLVDKIRARCGDFPLRIFTQFVNPPGSIFRTHLNSTTCPPGDPQTELVLQPGPGDLLLVKSTYGLTPAHIAALRDRGVTEVTVAGVDTDACVLGVMFSLLDAGIVPHLASDLCWSSTGLHDEAVRIAEQQFQS